MVVSDIAVTNPFSGERVGSVPRQSAADVERAVAAARGRQALDLDARAELLGVVARELNGRSEEFARRITAEA
jgi:acyl-CoA reductase-like NAD-dependent aldehyde dehydrogenase